MNSEGIDVQRRSQATRLSDRAFLHEVHGPWVPWKWQEIKLSVFLGYKIRIQYSRAPEVSETFFKEITTLIKPKKKGKRKQKEAEINRFYRLTG